MSGSGSGVVVTATRRRSDGGPSARALLVGVLGAYVLPRGEPVWTATLVSALEALGVEARAARQAVNRTAADGWLVGESVGRYTRWSLSPAGRRLLESAYSRLGRSLHPDRPWDGRFLLVSVTGTWPDRQVRHRLAAGLDFEGFGCLDPGLWVSADQRAEAGARVVLDELGLTDQALFFAAVPTETSLTPAEVVARAWDLESAAAAHEAFLADFADAEPADERESFALRTRLAHEWRHLLSVDPALPPELLPPNWAGARAKARFQELHARWAGAAESYYVRLADEVPAP
jgi:phenylacetic acid degradation operon negative regulatory protein